MKLAVNKPLSRHLANKISKWQHSLSENRIKCRSNDTKSLKVYEICRDNVKDDSGKKIQMPNGEFKLEKLPHHDAGVDWPGIHIDGFQWVEDDAN